MFKNTPVRLILANMLFFLFFLSQHYNCYAQQDTIKNTSILREDLAGKRKAGKEARRKKFLATLPANHNPKTASLLALIPGMGQIYNRRFWKLPIVYGGLGTFGYFTVTNYIDYNCYRTAYLHAVDSDPNTNYICPDEPNASAESLKIYRDNARESAEFFVLGFTFFYGLTIIDAFVDAHLMHFDISDDLSMLLRPKVDFDFGSQTVVPALGLTFQHRIKEPVELPVHF
jgi:hypothetical protein